MYSIIQLSKKESQNQIMKINSMPSFYHTIQKASFAQHFIKNDRIQEKGSQTWVLPEENSSSILEMMVISKLKATPIVKTMCYHLCTEPKLSTCLLQAIFCPGQNCMDAHSYINPKTQKFPSCNIYYYKFQTLQRSIISMVQDNYSNS